MVIALSEALQHLYALIVLVLMGRYMVFTGNGSFSSSHLLESDIFTISVAPSASLTLKEEIQLKEYNMGNHPRIKRQSIKIVSLPTISKTHIAMYHFSTTSKQFEKSSIHHSIAL